MQQKHNELERELIAITEQFLIESEEPYHREIRLDLSLQNHLGIDSLGRAELLTRIEKKFSVNFPDTVFAQIDTLQDIISYLSNAAPQLMPTQDEIIKHDERTSVDPSTLATLVEVLVTYATQAPNKTHIYFQHESGVQEKITYGQLLTSALKVAHGLKKLGLQEYETVAIMQPTHPDFFAIFFGILLAGGVPVPIYPPFRLHMLEEYARTESHILNNAEVRILITFQAAEKLSHLIKSYVPSLSHVVTMKDILQSEPLKDFAKPISSDSAFIQYTSGSTNLPKGVLLTHDNLLANIRAYGKTINIVPGDVVVSWLPLYHDMGLIGMWLGSLYYGIPLVLLTPFTFLNRPERWLWAIHHHRGTLSGAPNFAYELCVRKIEPSLIEGLDLSSWRIAANGAEKIYPQTLQAFTKKFAPFGFKPQTLLPVYGLAESTVCLTIPPIGRIPRIDLIDRISFDKQQLAKPSTGNNTLAFVGCGMPLADHAIRIVDKNNHSLPERHVGHLQFKGPSMMKGYYNNPQATEAILHDGWYDSGDLAYLADNELFLTGRSKDIIIKAGRNLYPAEIEELVGNIAGIRQGCVTAFGVTDEKRATEQLIVVAETREKNAAKLNDYSDAVKNTIIATLDIVPDHIVLVAPHTIPKTSSGKLQRSACKNLYLAGKLGKHLKPAWWQVVILSMHWLTNKISYACTSLIKLIYTLYVALIVFTSYVPLYIFVYLAKQPLAAKITKIWARFILRAALCPIKIINQKNLISKMPLIYVANHASYMDAIVSIAILPSHVRMVGKKELFTMPLTRMFMRKLNYIGVDRLDSPKGIEDTKTLQQILTNGDSVMIFPEGTFGYAAGLRPFRLGAFKIAAETNTPICPLAIQGTRYIMRDGEWLLKPGKIGITVCEPIKPTGQEWQDVTQLRNAVRKQIAAHCGEPSLDFITAHIIAPKSPN